MEMVQTNSTHTETRNGGLGINEELGCFTFSFLPSMVVMSASLPSVNELVTDLLGVLDVTTKSLPFCCISITGLISLANLIVSSGNPAKPGKTGLFVRETANSSLQKGSKDPSQYWNLMSKLKHKSWFGLLSFLWAFCSIPFSLVRFWCCIWWGVRLCLLSFLKGDDCPWKTHVCVIFPGKLELGGNYLSSQNCSSVGVPHNPFLGHPWHDLKVSLSPGEELVLWRCQTWNWILLSEYLLFTPKNPTGSVLLVKVSSYLLMWHLLILTSDNHSDYWHLLKVIITARSLQVFIIHNFWPAFVLHKAFLHQ